jgi:hypothetical protein
MKVSVFWLGLLIASLAPASAQVLVEVTQDQQQFLQGETLPVAVRVINRSGQTLHLGEETNWLTFSIESREGSVAQKLGEVPVVGGFDLESSKVAIKRVDLAPYFNLTQPGGYSILATVRISQWGREVTSPARPFTIIEGAKLWEQEVGVPGSATAGGVPEIRKYILQQANYLKGELRLYLRVTDSYGKVIRVLPIGPVVSFGRPETQIDKFSNLHLLYQMGPYAFSYSRFNTEGQLLERSTYDYVSNRPRLREDESGNISVTGGVRRVAASDIPPSNPDTVATEPPKSGKQ